MTAVLTPRTDPAPAQPSPVSTGALTLVELRKMVNTRSGAVLVALVFAIVLTTTVVRLFAGDAADRTLTGFLTYSVSPVSIVLPIIGVLSVTSEWSQRTALITFSLVPRRSRVVTAKLAAVLTVAVGTVVLSILLAAIGNGLAPAFVDADGSWSLSGTALLNITLYHVGSLFIGFAFGMITMNSVLGILVHFGVPSAWSVLREYESGVDDAGKWLDTNTTMSPLGETVALTGQEWGKVLVSVALWGVLPSVLGYLRLRRTEVK
ncbi:ABC transporter permease [Streptomyces boncukensis]|uniref:ABC transporter permease n=1 Tax=Streptomyces boncukensis TaxID=2711219 RepID=A0A6G4WZU5_9ACTN|nr:ABC transporter permease [Streptomyces boncukensis]NGO69941.1 ABC transporter permease [Streptomyces boncukensis]